MNQFDGYEKRNNTVPRVLVLILLIGVGLIQYPLWFGKGSKQNIVELQLQLQDQKRINEEMQEELSRLSAEAESLRSGKEAVELRARKRLNMLKEGEVLFRLGE